MEASALARRAPLGTLKPGHVSPCVPYPSTSSGPSTCSTTDPSASRPRISKTPRSSLRSAKPVALPRARSKPSAQPSHRASPRRNSTASATNSSSRTTPTRRAWDTWASPSPSAPPLTRSSATAFRTTVHSRTATSSTSTSPPTKTASTATRARCSKSVQSTRSPTC